MDLKPKPNTGGEVNPHRAQVRSVLREYGLLGPRPLLEEVHTPAMRLRKALDALGLLYTAFADFFATNTDRLPLADCKALVRTTPMYTAQELIDFFDPEEEGCRPVPEQSGPYTITFQRGRLYLRRFVNPRMVADPKQAQKMLKPLEEVLIQLWGESCRGVVAQFLDNHARIMDPEQQRQELLRYANNEGEDEGEQSEGVTVLAPLPEGDVAVAGLAFQLPQPVTLTVELGSLRRRCDVFFREALSEEWFPNDPAELLFNEKGAYLAGGWISEIAPGIQSHLFGYLTANLNGDIDHAFNHLIHLMRPLTPDASEDVLLHRMRAVVAFRDGSWSEAGDSLAEQLFVQWRFAREAHWGATATFAQFQTALFRLAWRCHLLDPETDHLREALNALRLKKGMKIIREMATQEGLTQQAEAMLGAMSHLPVRLEDLFAKTPRNPKNEPKLKPKAPPGFLPLLCLWAAIPVLSRSVLPGLGLSWLDGFSTTAFTLLGLLLLVLANRAGP